MEQNDFERRYPYSQKIVSLPPYQGARKPELMFWLDWFGGRVYTYSLALIAAVSAS
jgi:hypothetical protein